MKTAYDTLEISIDAHVATGYRRVKLKIEPGWVLDVDVLARESATIRSRRLLSAVDPVVAQSIQSGAPTPPGLAAVGRIHLVALAVPKGRSAF